MVKKFLLASYEIRMIQHAHFSTVTEEPSSLYSLESVRSTREGWLFSYDKSNPLFKFSADPYISLGEGKEQAPNATATAPHSISSRNHLLARLHNRFHDDPRSS